MLGSAGRRRGPDALRRELAQVDALISAHPLASQRIRAAHEIVARNRTQGPAAVDRDLATAGLPSAVELGKAQVSGTWSWWQLHRRRRRLQRGIARGHDR